MKSHWFVDCDSLINFVDEQLANNNLEFEVVFERNILTVTNIDSVNAQYTRIGIQFKCENSSKSDSSYDFRYEIWKL